MQHSFDRDGADYGSRDFVCRDPEGYVRCFGTYPKAHEPAS